MFKFRRSSIVPLLVISATACTATYPTTPTQAPALVALLIDHGAMSRVPVGSTRSFRVFAVDADGAFQAVTVATTFSSSDGDVAQPTAATVRAVRPGSAIITARYRGLEASFPFVVVDPSAPFAYPMLSVLVRGPNTVGARVQTVASLTRSALSGSEDVAARVTWKSDNPKVATIDQNGVITGVGVGVTLISVSLDGLTDWFWLSIPPA